MLPYIVAAYFYGMLVMALMPKLQCGSHDNMRLRDWVVTILIGWAAIPTTGMLLGVLGIMIGLEAIWKQIKKAW